MNEDALAMDAKWKAVLEGVPEIKAYAIYNHLIEADAQVNGQSQPLSPGTWGMTAAEARGAWGD